MNGDDVTATGLFVEHFQKDNVIWNGERGRTVFFQNELPYDAPNQAAWQLDGTLGYAAYKGGGHRHADAPGPGSSHDLRRLTTTTTRVPSWPSFQRAPTRYGERGTRSVTEL